MSILNGYPYTDFHEINLDFVLDQTIQMKELGERLDQTVTDLEQNVEDFENAVTDQVDGLSEDFSNLSTFVDNYFDNLDVQSEINTKLDQMAQDGELGDIILTTDAIPTAVSDWLEDNITPTTPAIDATLTIQGAAADSKAAGDRINDVNTIILDSTFIENFTPALVSGYIQNANGTPGVSNKYFRTDLMPGKSEGNIIVLEDPDYEFNIAYYDETGALDGTGYIGNTGYKTGKQIIPSEAEVMGISFRRFDQAVLSDNDAVAILAALKRYSLTDKTLTASNVAADAKSTGDKFNEVNTNITNLNRALTDKKWRQAITRNSYIKTDDGTIAANSTFCRTNLFDVTDDALALRVTKDIYKFYLVYYDETGALDGTGYIGWSGWSQEAVFIPENAKKFAVVVAKTNNTTITIAVAADVQESIVIYSPTDTSISKANKAADSIAVDNAINADKNNIKLTTSFTKGKYISGSTGALANNSDFATSIMITGYGNISKLIFNLTGYNYYVAEYGENGNLTGNDFIKISEWLTGNYVVPPHAKKIAITAARIDHEDMTNDDVAALNTAFNIISVYTEFFTSPDNTSLKETFNEVISLYDALVTNYGSYVSKNTLTYNGTNLYEYVFTTGNYNSKSGQRNQNPAISKPIVLICAGIHGYEKTSVMALYAFCYQLCKNNYSLRNIINYATIKVIPIVCPSGYDNDSRINANGVNINRNFDSSTWVQTSEGQNYSGASPADQPETKIVQNWMLANTSAMVYIDWHNSSYNNEISCLLGEMTETAIDYKKKYLLAMNEIIPYWQKMRTIPDTDIYAYTGGYNPGDTITSGTSTSYASDHGILGFTLETSWNVRSTGKHSNFSIGTSEEVIASILTGFNNYFCSI